MIFLLPFKLNELSFIKKAVLAFSVIFFVLTGICSTFAEGTKEIMPNRNYIGRLCMMPMGSQFALYDCKEETRLHIHIEKIGEKVYFGFGKVLDANQILMNDFKYRIKDPNGNIVVAEKSVPSSGIGFIKSYNEAIVGPMAINLAGYSQLTFVPQLTGDYYIEFYFPPPHTSFKRRTLEYFDITVVDSKNKRINGRVWSKEWQFTVTSSPPPDYFENPFYGKMHILSDDSIVTSVDFNGIKPYVFVMSANETGVANTGNSLVDRMSVKDRHTYPQYKIFLNNPDSIAYPSGKFGGFMKKMEFICKPDKHCIEFALNKAGAVQLLIDINGIQGYQIGTEDILIVKNVGSGTNCIEWNGNDGFGNPVKPGTKVKFVISYISGLTHMPIYDAEHNPNGYIIELVRPITKTTTFNLYWDDSNFSGHSLPPSGGCISTSGCHSFNNMFGDERTINTWWYAASATMDSIELTYSDMKIDKIITQNTCPIADSGFIDIYTRDGTNPIKYKLNNLNPQSSNRFSNLGGGDYIITVTDSNKCTLTDSVTLKYLSHQKAKLIVKNDTCKKRIGSATLEISEGCPPYQYEWNTNPISTDSSINNMYSGIYTLTVRDTSVCIFKYTADIKGINSKIFIKPTALDDTCNNKMGEIKLRFANAMKPLTYEWNTSPPQYSSDISNLNAGNYSVTITEAGICDTTMSFTIIDMPAPSPEFSLANHACVNDSVIVDYLGNKTPPDNYKWDFFGSTPSSGNGLGPYLVYYQKKGKYYVKLDVSKEGCPSSSKIDSIEIFNIKAQIDSTKNVSCFNGNDGYINVKVDEGVYPYKYKWSTAIDSTYELKDIAIGTYTVTITDSKGCKSILEQTINQPEKLITLLDSINTSCSYNCDGKITSNVVGGTPPYSYNWGLGSSINGSEIDSLCIGKYKLIVTDSLLCTDTAIISIISNSIVTADFSYLFRTENDDRNVVDFKYTGVGGMNFNWDFGDLENSILKNPSHRYMEDGTYTVYLIADGGPPAYCKDTLETTIHVYIVNDLEVPNVITPNNDGFNDLFVYKYQEQWEFTTQIFNRWGNLIYENSNSENWDGKYNGEVVSDGVYFFVISATSLKSGSTEVLKGTVTVIKN